ncbi:MAG: lysophospholipid acyltransferase family protein [Actinomycetota bacterium]
MHPRDNQLDFWWKLALATVGGIINTGFRLRRIDAERIPDSGAILAANHMSVLDPIVIAVLAAERGRTLRFLAAAEAFKIPVVGWGLRRLSQIPIRRGERDQGALDTAAEVIRTGALAGIFPEGRVNDLPDLLEGRRGAARLALASGAPFVPVGIWGTHRRWPKTGLTFKRPLRPELAVAFGDPIYPSGDAASADDLRKITETLMEAIEKQRERARQAAGPD